MDINRRARVSGRVEDVTITVSNNGNTAITDVELKDLFPENYGILSSGSSSATWERIAPGGSVTNSYELSYENPGAYTNMPAILKYDEAGATLSVSYNILPAKLRNPSGFGLVSENYLGTFDLIDMLTGNGDFFQLIPLAFIALIAAIDVFKI